MRQRHDDAERHRSRHRQHTGRLCAVEAGRVCGDQTPADRRTDPDIDRRITDQPIVDERKLTHASYPYVSRRLH